MFRKIIILSCAILMCSCACAEAQYDEIRDLGHGYSSVRSGSKWGVINAEGKIVLPPQNEIVYLEDNGTLHYLQKGNVHSLSLKMDRAAIPNLDADASAPAFVPSTSPDKIPTPIPSGEVSNPEIQPNQAENQFFGYVDAGGSWVIDPRFEEANAFQGDYAIVKDASGKYGVIDKTGAYTVKPEYDALHFFTHGVTNSYIRAAIHIEEDFSDDKYSGGVYTRSIWGVIDPSGKVHVPIDYDDISPIADDGTITASFDNTKTIFQLGPDGIKEVRELTSSLSLEDYMPFTGSKLAKLSGEPTLEKRASAKHGHPRLDGATALFPVYAAIVEAVYPDETRYSDPDWDNVKKSDTLITCTKTNRAYERLIEGEADIIFCAGPSDAQLDAAKQAGVEFELTPFGKEAFVFFVNKDNPLENITVEHIQQIYAGKTTRWDQLGVSGLGEIIAYQRPENSGSQTALQRLMGDIPIVEAPSQYVSTFMEDIVQTVEYRNLANAIGYSFRFFCTEMMNSDVKLLPIDGIAPTVENIRSEAYPITSTLYMVTRKGEKNPNVRALMDWVLSDQGQCLVEKAGYVGIN